MLFATNFFIAVRSRAKDWMPLSQAFAFGGDFFQFVELVGRENNVGAGAGERLRCQCTKSARCPGNDGRLALDVEQAQRVFQEGFGHGTLPTRVFVFAMAGRFSRPSTS